jgi:hypothetical protein
MTLHESLIRFRNRAQQLPNLARATKDDAYRKILLEWAEEFDRLAVVVVSRGFSKTRNAYYGR